MAVRCCSLATDSHKMAWQEMHTSFDCIPRHGLLDQRAEFLRKRAGAGYELLATRLFCASDISGRVAVCHDFKCALHLPNTSDIKISNFPRVNVKMFSDSCLAR